MTELEYCEHWCGPLSEAQKVMLAHKVSQQAFVGVARAVGRSKYFPMVLIGKTPNVIDAAGYYQLTAIESRRGYDPNNP